MSRSARMRNSLVVSGWTERHVRWWNARATLASRTQVKGLGECECIKALVGGQPHEPVDAAGASQPLELVLACVF